MQRNKQIISWLIAALVLSLGFGTVRAESGKEAAENARKDIAKTLGFVPHFFQVMADAAVGGVWGEMKGLQLNPNTALPGKVKELIGLATASQIPCRYCVYAHTEFAKLNGASDAELAEAVAVAALARQFSTYTHGLSIDDATSQADLRRILDGKPGAGAPIEVVDAATARKDIEQTWGFVPVLFGRIPEAALPGAWRELKELRLSPNTALSSKSKALIALAVASQIPSRSCIATETEFSKHSGASERELAEAVGIAAITRNLSTMLNGQQTDDRVFNGDVDRIVSGAKAAQKKLASKK